MLLGGEPASSVTARLAVRLCLVASAVVGVAILGGVKMQPYAKHGGALFQGIGGGGLQVVGQGDDFPGVAVPGDPAGAELAFHQTAGGELADYDHFLLVDFMADNLKAPGGLEGIVQALDDRVALDVVDGLARAAVPLFDLVGGEWLFKQISVHVGPPVWVG